MIYEHERIDPKLVCKQVLTAHPVSREMLVCHTGGRGGWQSQGQQVVMCSIVGIDSHRYAIPPVTILQ